MRDKRFVAEHRGGPLKKEQHYQLIKWACVCVENILPLLGQPPDERLINALTVARKWAKGNATVGDARKASSLAIALANETSDPVSIAVARAAGHAVATAHMADHALRAVMYVLKAVKIAGLSTEAEREWQQKQLHEGIVELALSHRTEEKKEKI